MMGGSSLATVRDEEGGMGPFEYLSLLTSVVIGLGITRLLVGIGRVLQGRRDLRPYWVHLLWSLNVFVFLLLNWWILFRWRDHGAWSFYLFVFVLLSPIVSFLLTVLLYPEPLADEADFEAHFFANHRWFFGLGAMLPVIDLGDTLLKGWQHFLQQGPLYLVTLAIIFVMSVVAASTRSRSYHAAFALFFLAYLLGFIGINLRVIT
jgi:hypothetical protein